MKSQTPQAQCAEDVFLMQLQTDQALSSSEYPFMIDKNFKI